MFEYLTPENRAAMKFFVFLMALGVIKILEMASGITFFTGKHFFIFAGIAIALAFIR